MLGDVNSGWCDILEGLQHVRKSDETRTVNAAPESLPDTSSGTP